MLMSSVSHELRTPLNGSLTMLEMANEEDSIPEIQKENYLKPALYSNKILLYIINDILDYTKFNSNKLSLSFFPTDIE